MVDYVDYDRKDWRTDPKAAFAEAERRIALTAESDDPEVYSVIDFSDLKALEALPESFAGLERLEQAFLGTVGATGERPFFNCSLVDIEALRGLKNLKVLSLVWARITDAAPLSGLTGLTTLYLRDTRITDAAPLSGLAGLTRLDLSGTRITDAAPLSGLTGLTRLDLSGTRITDAAPLSGLTGLTMLHLGGTRITDAAPLSGLTGLTRLYLGGTRITDIGFLLELPEFAEGRGKELSVDRTPAVSAEVDRRLDMLSRLPPERQAVEVIQYLKGEHPDFRDPPAGVLKGAGLATKLAEASDVAVSNDNGVLHLENKGEAARAAPVELGQRVEALRAHLAQLLEAEATRQVPNEFRSWLRNYSKPLEADEPIYLLLDGPMAFISGAVGDPYMTEGLDGGFVEACRMLVTMHDDLRPLLLPEAQPDDLPELSEEATPERGIELVEDVAEALDDPAVGEDVREVLGAIRDLLVAAKDQAEKRPGLVRRSLIALGGFVGVLAAATGVHTWAVSPAGSAVIARLQPILDAILKFFGA